MNFIQQKSPLNGQSGTCVGPGDGAIWIFNYERGEMRVCEPIGEY